MTTKKKGEDEALEQAVDDGAVVDEAGDDAPAEVENLNGDPVATDEDGLPILEENPLATAQGLIGVPMTGAMNHATKMALRAWQRAHGLPPSGQFDGRTRAAMHL